MKKWFGKMLLLPALLAGWSAMGQDANLKRADAFFDAQDYHTAARMYEQILRQDPKSGIAMFKAGVSYLFTSQPEKGLSFIRTSAGLPLEQSPYYDFWLGRAYHLNMKLDSALMAYRKYLGAAGPNDEYRKGVEGLITQAHRTESFFLSNENSPFEAINLGENINSPYTERNPMVSSDGHVLVFTSRRPLFPDEMPNTDGEYREKTFMSIAQADGSWGRAVPILQPEDRRTWYRVIQFIEDDTKLLLYLPGRLGGLFLSERSGDGWKLPVRMNEKVKAAYMEDEVHFSPDMKQMVFAKTRPGQDNSDVYVCQKDAKGQWKGPRKLPNMNTNEDEIAPVFVDGGTALVFGSKGHSSLGGFDLFKTWVDKASPKYGQVESLGYPVNSPGNEISYADQIAIPKASYISSARAKGYGEADIYKITYTLPVSKDNK